MRNQAARAAVTLSRFEATAEYGRLYQEMHLDCQALVPAAVVVGWYRNTFAPRRPGVITDITGVDLVSWTWAGNDKTYLETAEVSFVQSFGVGGPVRDKVRLVRENGRWRWFFGRDVDFINQQIAVYAPMYPPIRADRSTVVVTDAHTPPWNIATLVSPARDPEAIAIALPSSFAGNTLRITPLTGTMAGIPSYASDTTIYQYTGPSDPAIPSAVFGFYRLVAGVMPGEAMGRIKANGAAITPADTVLVDGNEADAASPFLLVRQYTNDAVGIVPFLYWGAADGRWLYAASALELAGLRLLLEATVANVQTLVLNPTGRRPTA